MADQQALAKNLSTGIFAFPATPFTADGALDNATLESHVAAIATGKPVALVPAGGAGELFSIDIDEHAQVIRTTVGASSGVPVVAGIGGGLAIAQRQARNAERSRADALLLLPPYLVNSEQDGLAAYVRGVAASTGLPLIVYSRDNGVFRVDTLLKLADSCPSLIGVKDGTGDLDLVLETRRRTLGRLLMINGAPTAEMLAAQTFAIGVTAYSSAVFAFAPEIAQAFYDAVVARRSQPAGSVARRLLLPLLAHPPAAGRQRGLDRQGRAQGHRASRWTGAAAAARSRRWRLRRTRRADRSRQRDRAAKARRMMRIALVGNTQAQLQRLKRLLPFEAEFLLDDDTRSTRNAPLRGRCGGVHPLQSGRHRRHLVQAAAVLRRRHRRHRAWRAADDHHRLHRQRA